MGEISPRAVFKDLQLRLINMPAFDFLALNVVEAFRFVLPAFVGAVDKNASIAGWLAVWELGQLLPNAGNVFLNRSLHLGVLLRLAFERLHCV